MKRTEYKPYDSGMVYVWALLLPLVISVVISFCLYGSPTQTGTNGKEYYVIAKETWFLCFYRFLLAGLLVGLFFIYNKARKIDGFSACGIKQKSNYFNIAICAVLGIGAVYLFSPFITLLTSLMANAGLTIQTDIDLPLDNFGYYMLSLFLIGVLPAITEELIYRGIIFNGLKKWGKWPAILLSALAFSLMHGNFAQLPYTFILGIILGFIVWQTGALWLSMITHFFNNATVITSMYINKQNGVAETVPTSYSTSEILITILMLLLAVGFVVLIFYLLTKTTKKAKIAENNTEKHENLEKNTQNSANAVKKLQENTTMRDVLILGSGLVVALIFVFIQSL